MTGVPDVYKEISIVLTNRGCGEKRNHNLKMNILSLSKLSFEKMHARRHLDLLPKVLNYKNSLSRGLLRTPAAVDCKKDDEIIAKC